MRNRSIVFLTLWGMIFLLEACRENHPETSQVPSSTPRNNQKAFSQSASFPGTVTSSITTDPPSTPGVTPSSTSTPAPSHTPIPTTRTCPEVESGNLRVYLDENPAVRLRQGPGCEYPAYPEILVKPDPLSFFTVLGQTGDWWLVNACSDSPAWVFGPSIALNNRLGEAESIPELNPPPAFPAKPATSTPLDKQDAVNKASEVLVAFFDHLQAKEFAQAVSLFGGGYGIVRMWNEDIDPQDFQALMMRGCDWNGFNCTLKVKRVMEASQISAMEYHLTVEFLKPDGDIFELYNLADPNAPPRTAFTFTVIQDCDGIFYVIDWPIFTG